MKNDAPDFLGEYIEEGDLASDKKFYKKQGGMFFLHFNSNFEKWTINAFETIGQEVM